MIRGSNPAWFWLTIGIGVGLVLTVVDRTLTRQANARNEQHILRAQSELKKLAPALHEVRALRAQFESLESRAHGSTLRSQPLEIAQTILSSKSRNIVEALEVSRAELRIVVRSDDTNAHRQLIEDLRRHEIADDLVIDQIDSSRVEIRHQLRLR